jgi:2-oxoacid:acceptor oxidoreductase gamma subunit (pyruvate/2-ketoisovalerate family)/2-oxoacid:acceptor oxidoreductase delta subunit (pyruvate/2-ketoisovalerate family)
METTFEIRLHGRGGQGGVTCAKLLAGAYARLGLNVQTFGDYAGERSGAPVRAYTRVSEAPIQNRNKVYRPDHVLVLDESLLGPDTVQGLAAGGTLLINASSPPEEFADRFGEFAIATVDATEIARRHGIGTRAVVIVNTTIAGAFARLHGVPLDALEQTYRVLGLLSNFPAAREAYEAVLDRSAGPAPVTIDTPPPSPAVDGRVLPLTEHLESGPTGIQTGTWSSQRPEYVEKLAPCNAWCPAGNDVVNFVQAAASGDEEAGRRTLASTTPLPAVCGRVCPAPCMEGCNRSEYDGAVNIRGLERWLADHRSVDAPQRPAVENPRSVAILGGGPAGLAAAQELALAGHRATIYEGEQELGGVLRTGIPCYRLPREVLDREVAALLALGVEARCGEFLSPEEIEALHDEYDAVIVATGLQSLRGLGVRGEDLRGVEQGIRFLRRVNLEGGAQVSGHVVVLGGGNTAMDCARSAVRSGAERVTVAYRRSRAEMPAIREEIEEAEQEGVRLLELRQPIAFSGNGRVTTVELAEVRLGDPDDTGRRRPVVTEVRSTLACDGVLLALGQSADFSLLPDDWELREGRFFREGAPLRAYAAGDLATGDGTVAHAIGHGRRAATLALADLGEDVEVFDRPDRTCAVPVTDIRVDHFAPAPAMREWLTPPAERVRTFDEVSRGLGGVIESHRCFACGHCTECDTCLVYCPEGIIRREAGGYGVDYTYCKGCGICVEECPRRAMEMTTP